MSKMVDELKEYILGLCKSTDDTCVKDKAAVVADRFPSFIDMTDRIH